MVVLPHPVTAHNMKAELRVCSYGYEVPPAHEVTVDPDGDLYIRVGEGSCMDGADTSEVFGALFGDPVHVHPQATEFLVDSKALSRASPVLSRMLNGGFTESQRPDPSTGEKWIVRLPEDDIEAMSTLLHIMHCRFDKLLRLTNTILLGHLYQIAVTTDKYRCTHLVQPWIKPWLAVTVEHLPKASCYDLQVILWIAWEYGSQSIFEAAFKKLLWDANQYSVYFFDVLEPTGLQGTKQLFRIVSPTVER